MRAESRWASLNLPSAAIRWFQNENSSWYGTAKTRSKHSQKHLSDPQETLQPAKVRKGFHISVFVHTGV